MLTTAVALALAVALLVGVNLLNNRFAVPAYLVTSVLATAGLLALSRAAGLSWAALGLGRDRIAAGLLWGLAAVLGVALGYLVLARLPATRGVFRDRRGRDGSAGAVAYQMLVRIPFGTVLLEEVAFRGALYGLARARYGGAPAVALSCVLFGLWHILPSAQLAGLNPVAGRAAGNHPARLVAAAVGVSGLAGLVLCLLRLGSGSLLAPAGLHWATNALGYLAAVLAVRSRRPGCTM